MSIIVKRKLFVLYYLVVVIISLYNSCYLVVGLYLDDRRSCCYRPYRSSPRLTILAIVQWRLDCSRDVFIKLIIAALYIVLTLLLRYDLLLLPVELSLIMITISALVHALVCESSQLLCWPTIELLLINVFVGQLLDKRRDYGIDYRTIDLGT
jgi:hypothetical protein